MLVGCKVTLRKKALEDFMDNLILALVRIDKFKNLSIKSFETLSTLSYIFFFKKVLFFYPIELGLGFNTDVKNIDINFLFSTFSIEEKLFLLMSKKLPMKIF